MRTRRLLAAVTLLATPVAAQEIGLGRWTGVVHFAEADSAVVAVVVSRERGRLLLDVTAPNGTTWGLGDVRSDSTRLRFSWALDGPQPMQCALSRRSATYWEGFCDRRPDRLLMTLYRK